FNPTGTTQFATLMQTTTGGTALTPPLNGAASQRRTVPIPVFKDDFTYIRGKHNIQVGGTFKPIRDTDTLVSDFNNVTVGIGNNLTSLTTADAPPDLLTPSATALRLWSQGYAAMLGRISNVNSLYESGHDLQVLLQGSGHTRNYRYYETELYAQDSWRVRNDF